MLELEIQGRTIRRSFAFGVGCVVVFWFLTQIGGALRSFETTYNPVSRTIGWKVLERTPDYMVLEIEFRKIRKCEYRNMQVFAGERNGRSFDVNAEFEVEQGSRPTGAYAVQNWKLYTNEPVTNLYADVIHKCHFFWDTRSKFLN